MLIGVKDSQSDLEKHYKTFCGLYHVPFLGLHLGLHDDAQTTCIRLNQIVLKEEILNANCLTFRILLRAEDGAQTRDPQLGRLMLYQLSYFRNFLWAKMDSNHRRRKPADLQSAPFGHSGICPFALKILSQFSH